MNGIEVAQLMDELHRIHQQIGDLNHRAQRLKKNVLACNANLESAKQELSNKQELKQKAVVIANERERNADQAALELARRREQLNLAKSDREYEAIKIQIEVEERKNDASAELALEALNDVEVADGKILDAMQRLKDAEETLTKAKALFTETIPKLQKDMERTVTRLRAAESKLPRDWAGHYVRCVQRFGGQEALAPLTEQVFCGFCNCQVTLDTILKVCSGSALLCASCGRLLYMPIGYKIEGVD